MERLSSGKNLGPFVPPTVASRSPYLPPARSRVRRKESAQHTLYEELARCYAVYVTLARCKCVAPHAISWSNGPRSRSSYLHSRARASSCSCTDKYEKNRTIIGAANLPRARRIPARKRNIGAGECARGEKSSRTPACTRTYTSEFQAQLHAFVQLP